MRLSDLEPRVVRRLFTENTVNTRTELRGVIRAIPEKKRWIRWKRYGKVSVSEISRCQRYAEIIAVMRELNYGAPAYAIAMCIEADLYQVYRDLAMMVKFELLIKEPCNGKIICTGSPAALYYLK